MQSRATFEEAKKKQSEKIARAPERFASARSSTESVIWRIVYSRVVMISMAAFTLNDEVKENALAAQQWHAYWLS